VYHATLGQYNLLLLRKIHLLSFNCIIVDLFIVDLIIDCYFHGKTTHCVVKINLRLLVNRSFYTGHNDSL
jgi:hypothetical protein